MILGRIETFASQHPVWPTFKDAAGTALGFAMALLLLGGLREVLGQGTLFAGISELFGLASNVTLTVSTNPWLPLAQYPPGAFIIAGLLFALLIRPEPAATKEQEEHEPS